MENKTPKSDLIPCEHCGHMISKTAKTCPECGGRNRKYISAGKVVLIVVMLIIFAYLTLNLCFPLRSQRVNQNKKASG